MIKKNLHFILIGAALVLILAMQSFYIVQQPEQAIVLQFGDPVRLIQEPGLKMKIPFIQNVVFSVCKGKKTFWFAWLFA